MSAHEVEASKRFLRDAGAYGFGDHVTDPRAFVLRARIVARRIGARAELARRIGAAR